ncbi:alanine racemase [Pseudogemmatithrix spongiicola]|uniref:Alanine racemase n=1 Tax=Pseudogemmatithrix spongiicola TaxID=3062599 RepID=A0AA49Q5A8_9BACT|nr:alanine racemase [Gemmatimonadaceae bacterium 'strain 138']WKW15835.1 alanine racemase [Gemmatimonadaceae bacterium 'strain 318']
MTDLDALPTPSLLLDRDRFVENHARLASHLRQLGVPLRPHVKTAKSLPVIRYALRDQPGGVTVSTLREAAACLDGGIRDILYAVGIAPQKLADVAALQARGAEITVILDSVEAAQALRAHHAATGRGIPVLVEIDSDGHRAGVAPESALLLEIAAILGADLRGVMTHAGESYQCVTAEAKRAMAAQERDAALSAAMRLRLAGHAAPVVSVGSTPTAHFADDLGGVTEVRAGVYMFQDLVMAGLGVCAVDDIAISVLVTVIGHQPAKGWLITDGGWMALSRDRGTAAQALDQGYGLVCDVEGQVLDGLLMSGANQEHGIISRRDGQPWDLSAFPVGTRLRVIPNHACATAAQYGGYFLLSNHRPTGEYWERFNGFGVHES